MFRLKRCCIIVPTYNNGQVLESVLNGLVNYTTSIIIVNDGSTDETESILERYPELTIITYSGNKGKGYAIRTGFKKALEQGFENAITIDSDGQHQP